MSNRVTPSFKERVALRCALERRDGPRCFYCRRSFNRRKRLRRQTLDHYIPYSLWPTWTLENLVLACARCNFAKGCALPWPLVRLLTSLKEAA